MKDRGLITLDNSGRHGGGGGGGGQSLGHLHRLSS